MSSEILHRDPLIMTFHSGVDIATMEGLLTHDRWQRSLGWDFTANTSNSTDWRRSSTWFDTGQELKSVAGTILAAASLASGLEFHMQQAESLQLTRYQVGEYYRPHWDHFNLPGTPTVTNDRVATVIWYLNDDFQGGDTYFNNLDLTVRPCRNRCLLFYYADTRSHSLLLHEGRPVTQGEKLIATIWLRAGSWP